MTGCPLGDAAGVALRVATYLDCQGQVLGETGFAAVAGGIVAGSVLTGLVTIFVALIGYKLIFGEAPELRDGVTWVVRLGVVLTLATSWPAFQTLVYDVVVDGPDELAQLLLPASGLAPDDLVGHVQSAYDALRLGSEPVAAPAQSTAADPAVGAAPQSGAASAPSTPVPTSRSQTAQPPLPQTASLLVVFTVGIAGALRVAVGVLLALGPLAITGLLFDQTLGLVSGWLRSLAGAALALVAATVVNALELTVLDGELARITGTARVDPAGFDPQALTTIVLLFALVMLVATMASARVASALCLRVQSKSFLAASREQVVRARAAGPPGYAAISARSQPSSAASLTRASLIARAVTAAASRRQAVDASVTGGPSAAPRGGAIATIAQDVAGVPTPLGFRARRTRARPSRAAALRDRGR